MFIAVLCAVPMGLLLGAWADRHTRFLPMLLLEYKPVGRIPSGKCDFHDLWSAIKSVIKN